MPTLVTAVRNAMCNAAVDLIDAGAGTATLLLRESTTTIATINLPNPAFGAASTGVATLQGVPLSTTAGATGTIDNYQVLDRDATLLFSGSAGESAAEVIVDNADVNSGQTVNVTSGTFTMPAS